MGADVGEVAEVDGRDRKDRQPLAHRDHRSVGPAQAPVSVASHELGHAAQVRVGQSGQLECVLVTDAHAVQEAASAAGPRYLSIRLAGLGYHGRRHEQDVIVAAEPRGAFCMVLVPAIGQCIQDVSVNDDHEFSRLPAEALSQQLIGPLRHIGPPAVTDPDERRQGARDARRSGSSPAKSR